MQPEQRRWASAYRAARVKSLRVSTISPSPRRAYVGAMSEFLQDVALRDGTGLKLRTPTSEDYWDIKSFYDELSRESLYSRFNASCEPTCRHGWMRRPTATTESRWRRGDRIVSSRSAALRGYASRESRRLRLRLRMTSRAAASRPGFSSA